jgi:hypothetical protein
VAQGTHSGKVGPLLRACLIVATLVSLGACSSGNEPDESKSGRASISVAPTASQSSRPNSRPPRLPHGNGGGDISFEAGLSGAHATATAAEMANDRKPSSWLVTKGSVLSVWASFAPSPVETRNTRIYYRWYVICWNNDLRWYSPVNSKVVPGVAVPDPTTPPIPNTFIEATVNVPADCHPAVQSRLPSANAGDGTIAIEVDDGSASSGAAGPFFNLADPGRLAGPALPAAQAAGAVTVWRVVEQAELDDIRKRQAYHVPAGLTGKYYYPTREQAERLAKLYTQKGIGGPIR